MTLKPGKEQAHSAVSGYNLDIPAVFRSEAKVYDNSTMVKKLISCLYWLEHPRVFPSCAFCSGVSGTILLYTARSRAVSLADGAFITSYASLLLFFLPLSIGKL